MTFFQRSPFGNKRYWTRERIIEGLTDFVSRHEGELPRSDKAYATLKKGHSEWPPASRVLQEFGSMARGFLAGGAEKHRVSIKNLDWSQEEDEFLLENAGRLALTTIARRLGRTYAAVRTRLNKDHGKRAREVQCYLSAAKIAQHYNTPYSRVIRFINNGELKATWRLQRWQIDLRDAEKIRDRLAAPKRHAYKNTPPDVGDYYKRYGIRRRALPDGRLERYEVA